MTETDSEASGRPERSDTPPPPDLRVARVVEARDHPDADRLLVMDIDLGDEERQIVAGIVQHYELDELEGKHIVVVANLQPVRLRGQESQGMLLAAEDDEGRLGLLLAPSSAPGTRIAPAGAPEPADEITFAEFQEHELVAGPDAVTLDGTELEGADLVMDRDVYGRLR